jgi:hypothetical protein
MLTYRFQKRTINQDRTKRSWYRQHQQHDHGDAIHPSLHHSQVHSSLGHALASLGRGESRQEKLLNPQRVNEVISHQQQMRSP